MKAIDNSFIGILDKRVIIKNDIIDKIRTISDKYPNIDVSSNLKYSTTNYDKAKDSQIVKVFGYLSNKICIN